MVKAVAQLFCQGHRPQVLGVPTGVQSPVQAGDDQGRPAGGGKALAAMSRMGVDLHLDAPA